MHCADNILKQHLSWQLADEMREICQVFYTTLKINYVDYARYYKDGRIVSLFSDKHYVNSFFSFVAEGNSSNRVVGPGLHLWDEYIDKDFLKKTAKQFRHAHGITIITETKDYAEVFNLATLPENLQILSFYLNQQPILQQILAYVRRKTKKLINRLEDSPLIIPRSKPTIADASADQLAAKKILELMQQQNSFSITINHIPIHLTKREAECLYYLHQGKTAKEIARILSISFRTIEIYFDQLRFKTASKNRVELLGKISNNQLENLIITP